MHPLFTRMRGALAAPLPFLGLVAAVGPLAMASASEVAPPDPTPAEAAYHGLPALPEGSTERGVDGVVATAIELAATLRAVTTNDEGDLCDPDLLYVSWDEPGDGYEHGAHVTPVGPAPTASTTAVNGVVLCAGGHHSYMGFEARWSAGGDRWDVVAVPDISDERDEHLVVQPAPVVPAGPRPVPVLAAPGTVDGPIEGYAAYEPQRTCDPSPKAGTRALAGALLRDHPGSRNLGIVRGCSVGGRSEHKEGRAFDWGVNIGNPTEKAAAEAFIAAIMATDAEGNRHALARRMGVMYVIWDRQIWSSYRAADGWRPYSGASAHRDHVHISLSWAGALGRTSFWSGTVPPDLPTATPGRSIATGPTSGARRQVAAAAPAPTGDAGGGGGHRHRAGRGEWDADRAADELAEDAAEARRREEWRARRGAEDADAARRGEEYEQAQEDAEEAWRDREPDGSTDKRRRRRDAPVVVAAPTPTTTVAPAPAPAPRPKDHGRRRSRTTATIAPTTTTTATPTTTTTSTTAAPTTTTTETTTGG